MAFFQYKQDFGYLGPHDIFLVTCTEYCNNVKIVTPSPQIMAMVNIQEYQNEVKQIIQCMKLTSRKCKILIQYDLNL